MNGNEMGNMSSLEEKMDALLCMMLAKKQSVAGQTPCGVQQVSNQEAELCVEEVLVELGVPGHLTGFAYLRTGVLLVLQQPQLRYAITTMLYPLVARHHHTLETSVERSMRYAVETAWWRCDYGTQKRLFGNQIDPQKAKPTNAQFISRVAQLARKRFSHLQN